MSGLSRLDSKLPLNWEFIGRPIVIVDIETTGTKAGEDQIAEIAAIRAAPDVDGLEVLSTVLDTGGVVGRSDIHGLHALHGAGAPEFREIVPLLRHLFRDDAMMVAHSASFEERFLAAELEALGGSWGISRLCTMMLGRRLHPDRSGRGAHTLDGLLGVYGFEGEGTHLALSGALSVSTLLCCLLNEHVGSPDLPKFIGQSTKRPKNPTSWPDVGNVDPQLRNRGLDDHLGRALAEARRSALDRGVSPEEWDHAAAAHARGVRLSSSRTSNADSAEPADGRSAGAGRGNLVVAVVVVAGLLAAIAGFAFMS